MTLHAETMPSGTCVTPGDFRLVPREVPADAPDGWVLVDIAAVGLCGTDYHIFAGRHPYLEYPRVIGHELGGRVARDAGSWHVGDLVVVNPYLSCGACRACLRGRPNCCVRIEVLGVHRDGGLCSRIAVPSGNLYPAGSLTPVEAAMVEFLAIGAHAVSRSGLTRHDRVLVTGAGPIGLGVALFATLAGAEVHLLDRSTARLDQASRLGFARLHPAGEDILAGPLADGFDVVFDATGSAAAMEAGFAHLAHGSSYVLVGVVTDRISFDDAQFHKREARIVGSRNAVRADFDTVVAAMREGRIETDALCSELIRLDDLPARFAALAADRDGIVKAIVTL